jgi:hypothetical protein
MNSHLLNKHFRPINFISLFYYFYHIKIIYHVNFGEYLSINSCSLVKSFYPLFIAIFFIIIVLKASGLFEVMQGINLELDIL